MASLFIFFKMGHSQPLFSFRHSNTVDIKQMFNLNFVDDWNLTMDLWIESDNSTKWATTTSPASLFLFLIIVIFSK